MVRVPWDGRVFVCRRCKRRFRSRCLINDVDVCVICMNALQDCETNEEFNGIKEELRLSP